ncbi:MAG: rRNA maturation RNase YbeY, partial [Burkholderiales bacterium]
PTKKQKSNCFTQMKKPKLNLSVQVATESTNLPTKKEFRNWISQGIFEDIDLTVRLVDEPEGRELNKTFRGKDYATNILTFPYPEMTPLAGDVVICVPIVRSEAHKQKKTLASHFAHLSIHGVLHLQGYDHELADDEELMENLEVSILESLKIANPFEIS